MSEPLLVLGIEHEETASARPDELAAERAGGDGSMPSLVFQFPERQLFAETVGEEAKSMMLNIIECCCSAERRVSTLSTWDGDSSLRHSGEIRGWSRWIARTHAT